MSLSTWYWPQACACRPSELPIRNHFVLGWWAIRIRYADCKLSPAGNIAQYEMVGAR